MAETISASEFKAKCLKLMDDVAESGEPLIVTKNGRVVVRIVPVEPKRSLIGRGIGRTKILGDIVSPAAEPEDWEALR